MTRTKIIGTGSYAPAKVLTNKDLEALVKTSDAWIVERTGIRQRHVAAEGEAASDLALVASQRALELSGTRADELDLIIVGTISADMPMPSCAVFLQAKLGARKAFAFDVSAACAGSIYALAVADQFIRTGQAKRALIVGVEVLTRIVDWEDRNTCVLFGDGAGAMVLAPSDDEGHGILSTHLHSDGTAAPMLWIPGGGSKTPLTHQALDQKLDKVSMNGKEVFKYAVRALTELTREALLANGMTSADVDHVIAHQANIRIIDAVLERIGVPREKCWLNIEKYGNTSSASLPMSLDEANRAGKLRPGDVIAMMAIGAGIAWGGAVVRW
ncbi:MAG: beta-ketoacyl-ACP synthase III [Myxococcaceae bacterium]